MPVSQSESQLADIFSQFFMDKIKLIQDSLDDVQEYSPGPRDTPGLSAFKSYREAEMHMIIMSMRSKSCELDSMPTYLLKDVLSVVLPIITRKINPSLSEGAFIDSWNNAFIRPLIKKSVSIQ